MSEFAEPYAARVIAIMLGLPQHEWPIIAKESTTLGLALGVTLKQDLPRIEAALQTSTTTATPSSPSAESVMGTTSSVPSSGRTETPTA